MDFHVQYIKHHIKSHPLKLVAFIYKSAPFRRFSIPTFKHINWKDINWHDVNNVVLDALMCSYSVVLSHTAPNISRDGVRKDTQHQILKWEEYVQKFINLEGKCAYGKFYFRFEANHPQWLPSPERLNNQQTYLLDNVTFICRIFNTPA